MHNVNRNAIIYPPMYMTVIYPCAVGSRCPAKMAKKWPSPEFWWSILREMYPYFWGYRMKTTPHIETTC